MNKGLENYKGFIDGLVKRKNGVYSKWIHENGYPNIDENKKINLLLSKLSDEEKDVLISMLEEARSGGIHDTLAYMNEMMDCKGLELSQDGIPYPYDSFESMNYDYICRCEGDEWPE